MTLLLCALVGFAASQLVKRALPNISQGWRALITLGAALAASAGLDYHHLNFLVIYGFAGYGLSIVFDGGVRFLVMAADQATMRRR